MALRRAFAPSGLVEALSAAGSQTPAEFVAAFAELGDFLAWYARGKKASPDETQASTRAWEQALLEVETDIGAPCGGIASAIPTVTPIIRSHTPPAGAAPRAAGAPFFRAASKKAHQVQRRC